MAIYNLPNGSTYDTSYPYDDQPDETFYNFTYQIQKSITPVIVTKTGQDPNVLRPTSYTWTETSYNDYNYIVKNELFYIGNTYRSAGCKLTFERQNK